MKLKTNEVHKGTKDKIEYYDDEGFKYYLNQNDIVDCRNLGYSKYASYNKYSIQNILNYIKNNNINTRLLSTEYIDAKKHLIFQCGTCGKEFGRSWNNFSKGKYKICQDCIIRLQAQEKCYTHEYIEKKIHNLGYNIIEGTYTDSRCILDIEDSLGYRYQTNWNQLQNGKNPIRYRTQNKYFYHNVRRYFELNDIVCDIIEENSNSRKGKFTFICECGGKYIATLDEVLNNKKPRIRCKSCANSISDGELRIIKWLNDNNIEYAHQHRFDDCVYKRALPFDFYLPKYNICIEFDGAFHYKKQPQVSQEQFELSQKRDEIKNDYCKKNNIRLIRIPYWNLYNNKYKNILLKEIL